MSIIDCDPQIHATPAPAGFGDLLERSSDADFRMVSDHRTGALLRTLVASKPRGAFLELGTGTGVATQWLLSGMCAESTLISLEKETRLHDVARSALPRDPRLRLLNVDGFAFIETVSGMTYDLIFADGEPGKYRALDRVLALLKIGGFYVMDDMIATSEWPEHYRCKPGEVVGVLRERKDGLVLTLDWSTGLVIFVRTAAPGGAILT